jgi:putative transposase
MKRKHVDKDKPMKELIQRVYNQYDGKYGYWQLQLFLLQDERVWINHKKVLRLIQEMGLRSRMRCKHRYNYATSHRERVAGNILKRDFKAEKPNRKWVTDITQFRMADNWVYLSAIKDLFNNENVGYRMSGRNDNELVLKNFEESFAKK